MTVLWFIIGLMIGFIINGLCSRNVRLKQKDLTETFRRERIWAMIEAEIKKERVN